MSRATHTDAEHKSFHLQRAISEIHLHSIIVNIPKLNRWRRTELYISFALKADHNQNLQYDWNKPMFKKVLIQGNNSMEGEDRECNDKKYLVLKGNTKETHYQRPFHSERSTIPKAESGV